MPVNQFGESLGVYLLWVVPIVVWLLCAEALLRRAWRGWRAWRGTRKA